MNFKKKALVGVLLTLALTLVLGTNVFAGMLTFTGDANDGSGAGYTYVTNETLGTLTLNNYSSTDGIEVYLRNLEVILTDGTTNTIDLTNETGEDEVRALRADQDLIISGNGTLNINIDIEDIDSDVYYLNGIICFGNMIIKDDAKVNISIKSKDYGQAIYTQKGIKIQDTATLNISFENDAEYCFGIYAYGGNVEISSTGNQVITMAGSQQHQAISCHAGNTVSKENEVILSGANLTINFPEEYGWGIANSSGTKGKIEILNGSEVTINNGYTAIYDGTGLGENAKGIKIKDSRLTIKEADYSGIESAKNGITIENSEVDISSVTNSAIFTQGYGNTAKIDISGSSVVKLHSANCAETVYGRYANVENGISEINLSSGGSVIVTSGVEEKLWGWQGFVRLSDTTELKEGIAYGGGMTPDVPAFEGVDVYGFDETTGRLVFVAKEDFDIEVPTFTDAAEGYEAITAKPISITAFGGDRKIKSVVSSNTDDFELTVPASVVGTTVDDGDTLDTVTIRPVNDLLYGHYETTITVTGADDKEFTAVVTFDVTSPVRINIACSDDYASIPIIREYTRITLTDDVTLDSNSISSVGNHDMIYLFADVLLDLNGHTLTMPNHAVKGYFYGPHKFTITSSVPGGKLLSHGYTYSGPFDFLMDSSKTFEGVAEIEISNISVALPDEYEGNTHCTISINNASDDRHVSLKVINSNFEISGYGFLAVPDMANTEVDLKDITIKHVKPSQPIWLAAHGTYGDYIDYTEYEAIENDTNVILENVFGDEWKDNKITIRRKDGFEITAPTFDEKEYGYGAITAKPINITAIGTNRTISSVAVSGTDFALNTGDTIEVSKDATNSSWTIAPNTGLSVGTHETTITVTDSESNVYTATVTFVVNKATPTCIAPTGLTATYGDTLEEVSLTSGTGAGTWSWKEELTTEVGNAGNRTHKAVFTPTDDTNYKTVEADVTINVAKADQVFLTTAVNKTMEYKDTINDYIFELSQGNGEITYKSSDENYVWVNETDGILSAEKVTTSPITITVTAAETDNYKSATTSYTVTVTKKKLIKPTAEITTFVFNNTSQRPEVANVNTNRMIISDNWQVFVGTYTMTYDLNDTDNYCWAGDDSIAPVTINWSITPAPSTLTKTVENIQLVKGGSIDLSNCIALDPTLYKSDVTYVLDGTPNGISLTNAVLSATEGATTTSATVKVNFAGRNVGGTADLEYSAAAELVLTIAVTDKPSQTFDKTPSTINMVYGDTRDNVYEVNEENGGDVTYTSSDADFVDVDTNGKLTAKKVTTTPVTITVTAAATDTYAETSLTYQVNVSVKDVTVSKGTYEVVKTYNGTVDAVNGTGELEIVGILESDTEVTITTTPSNFSEADCYIGEGIVRLELSGVGSENYSITNEDSKISVPYKILKKDINSTIVIQVTGTYTYDGSPKEPTISVRDGLADIASIEYKVEYQDNVDAGTDAKVIVSVDASYKNNYEWTPKTQTFTIEKGNYTGTIDSVNKEVIENKSATYEIELSEITLPSGFVNTKITGVTNSGALITSATKTDSKVTYIVDSKPADTTGTLIITISSKNYNDVNAIVNVKAVEKTPVTIGGLTYENKTYDSYAVTSTGTLTADNGYNVANLEVLYEGVAPTVYSSTQAPTNVGTYKVTYKVPDTDAEFTGSQTYTFEITPASSTITTKSSSNKLQRGKEVNLKTLINLVPATYIDEVNFTIDLLPTGVTLDGTTLKATSDATLGNVTVKANFAGKDLNSDGAKEYSLATEVTFDVEIINKSTSGGGSGSSTVTKYDIEIKTSEGGTVKATPNKVLKGEESKLKVTAYEGYEIVDVIVDGKSVGAVKEYTIKNVKKDIKVEVTFKKIENTPEVVEPVETIDLAFEDVKPNDWFYDAIEFVLKNKLMNGTSGITFEPEATTTRAMIVTILYRLENEPSATKANIFSDVENGMWYSEAIAWANANGIVLGNGNGTFNPNGAITREQLVTILYRYANYKKLDTSVDEDTNILSYDDAFEVSEYAIPAMQWACGEGLVSGVTESLLASQGSATRAQIATIMMRFINNM